MLDCLQRIEGEMREGDHLFRIAGDKFVLLASSEAYETVLDQAERVFRKKWGKSVLSGNAVELAMFGGLIRLDQGDARSERLLKTGWCPWKALGTDKAQTGSGGYG